MGARRRQRCADQRVRITSDCVCRTGFRPERDGIIGPAWNDVEVQMCNRSARVRTAGLKHNRAGGAETILHSGRHAPYQIHHQRELLEARSKETFTVGAWDDERVTRSKLRVR